MHAVIQVPPDGVVGSRNCCCHSFTACVATTQAEVIFMVNKRGGKRGKSVKYRGGGGGGGGGGGWGGGSKSPWK